MHTADWIRGILHGFTRVNARRNVCSDFEFTMISGAGTRENRLGGEVGSFFDARSGSTVNILGSVFLLDGLELDFLELGQAFTILDRDVTLSGLLANGESFSFDLNSSFSPFGQQDFFAPDATLTVTLAVPEPSSTAFIAIVLAMGFARRRR